MGSAPQSDWYFFSHKDKKYLTGTRTNRATTAGFWKATGRDKIIYNGVSRIGLRKTLVFYEGQAPRGRKSDWIMHEYRLDEGDDTVITALSKDGWVICRAFKKKSSAKMVVETSLRRQSSSNEDGFLDQILSCIGKTCKLEDEQLNAGSISAISSLFDEKFIHLPWLESPTILSSLHLPIPPSVVSGYNHTTLDDILGESNLSDQSVYGSNNHAGWVALDRPVASQHRQLNCLIMIYSRVDQRYSAATTVIQGVSPNIHRRIRLIRWVNSLFSFHFGRNQ